MSSERRTFLFALLGLLVWSVVATIATIYYYDQYADTRRTFDELKALVMYENVMIDYGNGTQRWHNKTIAHAGSTVFTVLLSVTTNVDFKMYSYGVLVTSIDGVENVVESPTSGYAWLLYYWNATASKWTYSLKAVDAYILKPNEAIAWRYEKWS